MEINLGAFEQVQKTYINLRKGLEDYNSRCLNTKYDKMGIGFNKDTRFSAAKIMVSLDSWSGVYGNSSCATIISALDTKVFESFLIQYLNNNFHHVMQSILDAMHTDLQVRKEEACKQLEQALESIKKL